MQKWVAFLRGINVGGHRKVPMAMLRQAVGDDLGASDVRSYIASGNLVFEAEGTSDSVSSALTALIKRHFGFDVPVIVFAEDEMRTILRTCPFPLDAGKAVHGFLCFGPPRIDDNQVATLKTPSEDLQVVGNTVWIHAPDGIGRSKLVEKLTFGVETTARNLNTLTKMVAMLDAAG